MKKLILCLALLGVSSSVFAKWELNDVSYLFPLPKAKEGKDFLIKPAGVFPRPASGAAVHTFHDLNEQEFSFLARKLIDLKNENAKRGIFTMGRALNVHPGFRNPGFNSKLKTIILSTAKAENLVRFTFMKRLTSEIWWQFGGEDRKEDRKVRGTFSPINIARLGEGVTRQDFFNDDFHEQVGMKGTIMPPALTKADNPEELLHGWGVTLENMKVGIRNLNRIDNPRIHNPESMDCVSCHIPDSARTWLEVKHSEVFKKANNATDKYLQKYVFMGHSL